MKTRQEAEAWLRSPTRTMQQSAFAWAVPDAVFELVGGPLAGWGVYSTDLGGIAQYGWNGQYDRPSRDAHVLAWREKQ